MKWHPSEDGLIKWNVLGNSILSSLRIRGSADDGSSLEARNIYIHFRLTLKRKETKELTKYLLNT